ncbi:MAG: hypothetical protein H6Q77_85 [Gemmatimonadetes bacterium]|nr:hypothetical protein [Gemmatimonadota bacterium]
MWFSARFLLLPRSNHPRLERGARECLVTQGMRANRTLPIGSTTWRVLAAFDFDNQDLNGRAALVEGATLLLLRPDTLLEAIPLAELQLVGDADPIANSDPAVFRAQLTLRDGRTLALTGELADLDLLVRWVGYLQERQRKGRATGTRKY